MNAGAIVGIVGTGLIGGSIGLRTRRQGARTIGYDDRREASTAALNAGAIEESTSREELYARADIVVIAAHLDATIAEIERLRLQPPLRAGLIVDVASVKGPVCAAARSLPSFVATHPMAGSERSGAGSARADLFEGCTWAYVASGNAPLDERARAFIGSQGATPFAVGAAEHDRIVALTSHLPQLLGWAYARRVRKRASESLNRLMGATARELLRVGASETGMWGDVLRANAANLAPELQALGQSLIEAGERLSQGDTEAVLQIRPASGLTQESPPDILP